MHVHSLRSTSNFALISGQIKVLEEQQQRFDMSRELLGAEEEEKGEENKKNPSSYIMLSYVSWFTVI